MRSWDEFVAFVRGTRPRPPPGPKQPLVTFLLVLAALTHLPIVYLLVSRIDLQPAFTIVVGLVSMGLAWSGGVALEGRRLGTVRVTCAAGIAEGALAFLPSLADALGWARWLLVLGAALCAVALVVLARSPPRPATPRR